MPKPSYSTWPPKLPEPEEKYLLETLKDYGLSVGFCVKHHSPDIGDCAALAPITLFPSLFPRSCFELAEGVQKAYNLLYAKIASDTKWLEESISQYVYHLDILTS
jgi:hypothetical protein